MKRLVSISSAGSGEPAPSEVRPDGRAAPDGQEKARLFADSSDSCQSVPEVASRLVGRALLLGKLTSQLIVCTCGGNVYAIPCDAINHTGVWVRIESTLERQIGQSLDGLRADSLSLPIPKKRAPPV